MLPTASSAFLRDLKTNFTYRWHPSNSFGILFTFHLQYTNRDNLWIPAKHLHNISSSAPSCLRIISTIFKWISYQTSWPFLMVHQLILWWSADSSCHTWHSAIHSGCIFLDNGVDLSSSVSCGLHPSVGSASLALGQEYLLMLTPFGQPHRLKGSYFLTWVVACIRPGLMGVLGQQARLVGSKAT